MQLQLVLAAMLATGALAKSGGGFQKVYGRAPSQETRGLPEFGSFLPPSDADTSDTSDDSSSDDSLAGLKVPEPFRGGFRRGIPEFGSFLPPSDADTSDTSDDSSSEDSLAGLQVPGIDIDHFKRGERSEAVNQPPHDSGNKVRRLMPVIDSLTQPPPSAGTDDDGSDSDASDSSLEEEVDELDPLLHLI